MKKSKEKKPKSEEPGPKNQAPDQTLEKPTFPPREGKETKISEKKDSGPGPEISEETEKEIEVKFEIVEVCGDLLEAGFGIWHAANPNVPPLDPKRKELIKKPLAKVAQKYGFDRLAKQEVILLVLLGREVFERLKIKQQVGEDVKDDRRKEGQGKDHTSKATA